MLGISVIFTQAIILIGTVTATSPDPNSGVIIGSIIGGVFTVVNGLGILILQRKWNKDDRTKDTDTFTGRERRSSNRGRHHRAIARRGRNDK